ncbi:hypothetical protein ACFSM5_06310 [Lacibacterium aquatile]|uniref:Uncharacterized protein n=1 Tax=Lacibacterium aquatile TaxID=1168082 RepID=A0ABW5DT82_9PROT
MAEVDIGAIYQLLGTVAATQREQGEMLKTHSLMLNSLSSDMSGVHRDLAQVKKDVAGLRQTVTEYHASVLGHGVHIEDLNDRLRRVERHLGLSGTG